MKNRYGNDSGGFSAIELMIVLGIIAILATLAYPSYIDYVRKARRGEAQQLLMNWSINQEIWRSNNPSYAPDNSAELPKPSHEYYVFRAEVDPATYTLHATALGDQLNDKAKGDCTDLTLSSTSPGKTPPVCWGGESTGS